jgi:hypothetical protein
MSWMSARPSARTRSAEGLSARDRAIGIERLCLPSLAELRDWLARLPVTEQDTTTVAHSIRQLEDFFY